MPTYEIRIHLEQSGRITTEEVVTDNPVGVITDLICCYDPAFLESQDAQDFIEHVRLGRPTSLLRWQPVPEGPIVNILGRKRTDAEELFDTL